ncbi:disease resistance protein RUN1-like [Hevea brasiliensis]|uniref:disease resistance protein RUN1-like n=1 Tax=Hevea brasiliensis TaxID=3981 RepID=UPI0025FC392A|nr:disease resistance protein RUN1-like [Hevea brasiliensis]
MYKIVKKEEDSKPGPEMEECWLLLPFPFFSVSSPFTSSSQNEFPVASREVAQDVQDDGSDGDGDGYGCGSGGSGGGDGDSVVVLVVAALMVVVVVVVIVAVMILMASSSSSSSSINPQWKKYDAFISFRGADIREGFLSDLVYDEDGFVGIDSRVKEVESFLCLESEDVLMIGIWGMGDLVGGWNLYGPGSRVIVTSRDKQVLEIVDCRKCIIYEVEKLNDCESLRLFSLHAFKQPHPAEGYMKQLSKKVISYTQGVPLALKVLGCNLYGKSVTEWECELKKLETIPSKKIQGILRRSYDELDDNERSICLDIACFFFKGEDEERVKNILDCCGFSADSGIRSLLDKSLVTISEKKSSQLKQLWTEDAPFIENLKFMDLSNSKQLIRIPDPLKFPKLEVVILRVWLKFLRLLTLLPSGLGEFRCVEYPNLIGCSKLKSLPNSICNLKSLKRLDISHCVNLHGLPENLGDLESLENLIATRSGLACLYYLSLQGCGISEIPTLEWLDAENCTSLEFVSSTFIQGYMNSYLDLDLSKCINLDQSSSMDCLLLKLQSMGPPEV